MAVCYIMLPFKTTSLSLTGGQDGPSGSGIHGVPTASCNSSPQKVTVPTGLTYSGAWVYLSYSRTHNSLTYTTIGTYSPSSKVSWSGFAEGSYSSTTPYRALSSVPAAGTEVSCTYRLYLSNISCDYPAHPSCTYSVTYSYAAWLCLSVTLPSLSSSHLLNASDINTLATILNVTGVTANSAIAKAGPQGVGTAIGSKCYYNWNKSGSPALLSAITFDATKPLKSNLQSCITNLTDHFVYR